MARPVSLRARPTIVGLPALVVLPAFLPALIGLLVWLAGLALAFAAADLPPLTGRVVDNAGLLSAATQSNIETKLRRLEDQSGIQLVLATVKSLGGEEIEPFANRLFRAWKLGEQKRNNGVLLLVAPKERKVRIEVGYGLEGTLTDALSKLVIANAIGPRLKTGDYNGGIESGLDDIIAIVSTDKAEWAKRPHLKPPETDDGIGALLMIVVIFIVILAVIVTVARKAGRGGRPGGMVFIPTVNTNTSWGSGSSGSSGSSSSSGDSGFSGGGGSSGGGGASGDY